MKLKYCLLIISILFVKTISALPKYWIGADGANWSDPSNWSGGLPSFNDTAFFNTGGSVNIDINPNIEGIQVTNNVNVNFIASSNRTIIIGNGGNPAMVFLVDLGSTLTLGGGSGVSIQTYGNFTSNTAKIKGTLILGQGNSSWSVNSLPASFTNTEVTGTIRIASNNTGSVILSATTGSFKFLSGSLLDWQRSGGSAPNADFQNGSIINITGITGSMMNFNSSAIYNGLLIWNCSGQSISGSAANLLPAGYTSMDSIRIVNTGSGTVRFTTNPNGFTIGSLEVQGGTLEMGAPGSNSASLTDTITNELKISGGTLLGNATFAFDNLGAAYPTTTFLKGNFIMSGGVLDFSNRTSGNLPGGAYILNIAGNVAQTGGVIQATQGFGAQNQFILNGKNAQNLELDNMTGQITLVANNSAGGINVKNHINLPYFLNLAQGYIQLNNYNLSVNAGLIDQSLVSPTPRIVTNGIGNLIVKNVAGSTTQLFPIGAFPKAYNPITIANNGTVSNDFRARSIYGITPSSGIDHSKTINRTWNISSANPITPGTVGLTYQYADSEKIFGAVVNTSGAMEEGHFINGNWSIDPTGTITPAGTTNNYTVGPFLPASLDSSFVIGNPSIISAAVIVYVFNGTGNWDNAANWLNNTIPPATLPANQEIQINPSSGDCVLNVTQHIATGAKITVMAGKSLVIPGNLILQ